MTVNLRTIKLKKILARLCLSQNAFAKKVKASSGYFSQVMCADRRPSPKMRGRILHALNEIQRDQKLPEFTFDDLFVIQGR